MVHRYSVFTKNFISILRYVIFNVINPVSLKVKVALNVVNIILNVRHFHLQNLDSLLQISDVLSHLQKEKKCMVDSL